MSKTANIQAGGINDFTLITGITSGYRHREDKTNLPPGVLVVGSQNVLTNTANRVGVTKGYTLDGASSIVMAPILASYDWEMHTGDIRHLRAGFLTDPGTGKLQFRFVAANGTVTWVDLLTGLNSSTFNFTDYWDNTQFQAYLLMVNGDSKIYEWSGGVTTFASATNTAGSISLLEPVPTAGGSGYHAGDILSITTGGTGATASVDTIANGAVTSVTLANGGSGYLLNDVLHINQGNYDAKVLVTGVLAGAVTSIALINAANAGAQYTVQNNLATSTTSAGTGATVNVTGVANGYVTKVSLINPGTGYTTGAGKATTVAPAGGSSATVEITSVAQNAILIQNAKTPPELGFYTGTGINNTITLGGITYAYTGTSGSSFIGVTPDPTLGGHAAGDVIFQTVAVTANDQTNGLPDDFKNDGIANLRNQIYIGSNTSNNVYVSKVNDYRDYRFTSPVRTVGEGALLTLDGSWVAFIPQEDQMYVAAGKDQWYTTQFNLSADLSDESLSIQRLKTTVQQGSQSQYLTSKIRNNIVYVSNEHILNSLGRIDNVVLTPQISDLSFSIVDDMNAYDFTDGQVYYHRNYIYMAVPRESVVRIYNMTNSANASTADVANPNFYWEAPLTVPISRFSTIDGELYGHSYLTSESYKLFDGYNFNGSPIDARAVFSYVNFGTRSHKKEFNEYYTEGYISPSTTLTLGITYEIDGCATSTNYELDGSNTQYVCALPNDASLGKSSLGKNPLGSTSILTSPNDLPPKFRWIKTFPAQYFYEQQTTFSSVGVDQQWEILAHGGLILSAADDNTNIKD